MENSEKIDLNWFDLLNQPNEEIKKILTPFLQNQEKESKTFSNSSEEFNYESYPNLGISLCFKSKFLFSIYLYADFNTKFKKYQGSLPYNLNMSLTNEKIVSKFGEPNQKSGGKTMPIAISYDNLGLEINFITNNWNDYNSPISFCCIFKPENNPNKSICGVCAKNAQYSCGKCKLVKYCGSQCQKIHWKVHKIYCC